jgi:spermidine/putrescine transport system permease protein
LSKFSLGKYLLPTYISLAFIFLMFPIGYTFVFSFNDPFKNTPGWQGFTFDNWTGVCNNEAVCEALGNSILIAVAVAAAIVAGVWVKVWQCGEMFPDASLAACVLWK